MYCFKQKKNIFFALEATQNKVTKPIKRYAKPFSPNKAKQRKTKKDTKNVRAINFLKYRSKPKIRAYTMNNANRTRIIPVGQRRRKT